MPQPDPVPSPRHSMRQRFWRIFRLLALLSIVVAAIAVVLVTQGAGEVHAVDMNPCQTALLELKVAAIRSLPYDAFFQLFGRGRSFFAREMYQELLREQLSPFAARWWDRHIGFFSGQSWHQTFYYRGTAGFGARMIVALVRGLRGIGLLARSSRPARLVTASGEVVRLNRWPGAQ